MKTTSFLVDCSKLRNKEDLKCDDMGAWKHKGSPKKFFVVERNIDNKFTKIMPLEGKSRAHQEDVYMLRRSYSENGSDHTVRKVVATLTG